METAPDEIAAGSLLLGLLLNITILKFDSIESTNATAIAHAKRGADEGLCILAGEQTAGRGRRGRVWISGKGSGLYLSILLRPKLEAGFRTMITLMAAVAVYETLASLYDLKPDIKWPNDILVGGKKICGILAESTGSESQPAVIVGIGLNLDSKDFPPQLETSATSVFSESGRRPEEEELVNALTKFLIHFYEILLDQAGPQKIREEWQKRSSYFHGKKVRVIISDTKMILGATAGLEANGALRVVTEENETIIINAGEIESIRENSDYIPEV